MPFRQSPSTHTPYSIIAFDKNGVERKDDPDGSNGVMSQRVLVELSQSGPTDVFLFSHGWMGDLAAATDQYNRWIDAMARLSADAARMGSSFKPMWIGLHWPSKPWGEEELGGGAFAADGSAIPAPAPASLLETYLERLDLTQSLRARELMGVIFRENRVNAGAPMLPQNVADAYTALASLLEYSSGSPGSDPSSDNSEYSAEAAFEAMNSTGVAFAGGFVGGLLGPLRQLSFWTMKKRARSIGEGGMYRFVAQLQQTAPAARVHLMGHSFGCIVVSSICGGPNGATPLPRPVDSLALVQGALSHWAHADAIPSTGGRGYFNAMMHRPGVKGPIFTTRSVHDIAVGAFYPAAVSLVLQDPSFVINPTLIKWGAIGAFGIQGFAGSADKPMLPETGDYHFEPGKVYNLEASQFIKKMSGAAGAHSDIDGPQVAHAIWQAAFASMAAAPSFVPAEVAAVRGAGASAGTGAGTTVLPITTPPVSTAPNILLPKASPLTETDMPIPFGVQAETGQYLPPIKESDLDHIQKASQLAEIRAANANAAHLAPIAEVQPDDLSLAGWGVLFSSATPAAQKQAIKEALKPLLELRKSEAGDLFKVFDDQTGYIPGVPAEKWLTSRGSALNVVDPTQGVPYYLLLVGPAAEIPFEFQYDLDTYFAVGRIAFETPQEYAQYAQNIVNFEKGAGQQKSIAIFNTRNDGDRATALLHDQIAMKLALGGDNLKPLGAPQGYSMTTRLADTATKAELLNILRGQTEGGTPAILFTGSHGVAFSSADPQQGLKQGAVLTQDWAGPGSSIAPDTYFTAEEVPSGTSLNGMLHFFFACYSAGCPKFDTYSYGPNNQPVQIAKDTLVARLPQRMLLQGAQAVIGHIDRAWAYSFQTNTGQAMVQSFRDPLIRLLQGRRVGDALDVFDQRWSVLSSGLLTLIQNRDAMPNSVPVSVLANRWVARDDARNYVVLGDPAARLKIGAAPSAPGTGTASFGITAPVPADVTAEAPVVSFDTHIDARPELKFRDFTGPIELKAAVSPDSGYQLVQAALAQATQNSTVDVYIYSISAPHLMTLLKGARDRGATVRVMYDPAQMRTSDVQKLRSFGIQTQASPSHDPRRVFSVCHQKFLVVDRKLVVIESANWANTSLPEREAGAQRKKGNREWLVRVDDEPIANWYGDLFEADWNVPSLGEAFGIGVAAVPPPPAAAFRAPRFAAPRDFPVTTFTGQQMTVTPLTSPDNYFDKVLPMIRTARKRIWLEQQYIEGESGPAVPRLLDAVAQRQRTGVDVRIIVSSRFNETWELTKETLQDAKLLDHLRAINLDNFTHCHNKGVIVDDSVVVSSTNWSENSIRRAREAGILIHSANVAGFFGQVFEDDWTTAWSVSTADAQATAFEAVAIPGEEDLTIDPADRV